MNDCSLETLSCARLEATDVLNGEPRILLNKKVACQWKNLLEVVLEA